MTKRTVVVYNSDADRALRLAGMVQSYDGDRDLRVLIFADASSLKAALAKGGADVVMCDARSGDIEGNAVELLRHTGASNARTQIIFTGVSERNLVPMELVAHAFLLPTSPTLDEVSTAIAHALDLLDRKLERPFVVRTRQRSRLIHPVRVTYIESELRKLRIHMGGEVVETYGKLSDILQDLPDRFVQCHKSFAVNLSFVEVMERESLFLTTGDCIPVSQKRRKATREEFLMYVGKTL